MLPFPKSQLRTLLWFLVGLVCVAALAIGLPLVQSVADAASERFSPAIHAYTPANQSENFYWSAGVTKDPNHSPEANF
jgi:hypothetical protein